MRDNFELSLKRTAFKQVFNIGSTWLFFLDQMPDYIQNRDKVHLKTESPISELSKTNPLIHAILRQQTIIWFRTDENLKIGKEVLKDTTKMFF